MAVHAPGQDEGRRDEAGTEEVAALAAVLRRPAHVPSPRQDEDDDDLVVERAEGHEQESHVLPRQRDEFTCHSCFLVAHVSRRAVSDPAVCRDCG